MLTMAKKKTTPQRYGANVSIWIDPEVKQALLAFVETHEPKTTLTGLIEAAVKEYLATRGQWPPKQQR